MREGRATGGRRTLFVHADLEALVKAAALAVRARLARDRAAPAARARQPPRPRPMRLCLCWFLLLRPLVGARTRARLSWVGLRLVEYTCFRIGRLRDPFVAAAATPARARTCSCRVRFRICGRPRRRPGGRGGGRPRARPLDHADEELLYTRTDKCSTGRGCE